MSDLSAVGLNPDVEEAGEGFEVLPAGEYTVVLTGDEIKDTKAGNGKYIELIMKVTTGPHAGKDVIDRLNLKNSNATAEAIGQGKLKKICTLCGVTYPPNDTTKLYGKPFNIVVGVSTFTSNTTGNELKSNDVKGYRPENTAVPDPVNHQANTQAGDW